MAQQQQDDDYADEIQNPEDVQAGITDNYTAAAAGARNAFQLGNAVAAQGGNLIGQGFSQMLGDPDIGDPKVVQARKVQGAMAQVLQEANADSPEDESPLDKQQRVATLVAARMAGISPQIALKANMQAVALQEAKNQQGLISAQTRNVNDIAEENEAKTTVQKTAANYQVYGMTKDKYGLPQLQVVGDPVSLYDSNGKVRPEFSSEIAKMQQQAKSQGIDSPVFDTVGNIAGNKQQLASTRADAILQKQQSANQAKAAAAAASTDEMTNKYIAASYMLDYRSVPSSQRVTALQTMQKYGLTPADGIAAKAEVAAMKASAAAVGSREGNIQILNNSIDKLGDNVTSALDGVDRTRFPVLNRTIALGKAQAGSPEEKKYAIAVNGMVQEYARLMSGGTGITSDQARNDANALISKADSPAAMRAAIAQLHAETSSIKSASNEALETLANPGKYSHMLKIQNAMGIQELPSMVDDNQQPIPGTGFSAAPAAPFARRAGPAGTLVSGSPSNGARTYNAATGKFE